MTDNLKEQLVRITQNEDIKPDNSGNVKVTIAGALSTWEIIALGEQVAAARDQGYDAVLKRSGAGMSLYLLKAELEEA